MWGQEQGQGQGQGEGQGCTLAQGPPDRAGVEVVAGVAAAVAAGFHLCEEICVLEGGEEGKQGQHQPWVAPWAVAGSRTRGLQAVSVAGNHSVGRSQGPVAAAAAACWVAGEAGSHDYPAESRDFPLGEK